MTYPHSVSSRPQPLKQLNIHKFFSKSSVVRKVFKKFKDFASVKTLRKHVSHLLVLLKRSAGHRWEETFLEVKDKLY